MPRYLVERTSHDGLAISITEEGAIACLNVVTNNAEDPVTWVHSYVTENKQKTFCIYDAPSPEAIRRAGRRNNLPADHITEVRVLASLIPISTANPAYIPAPAACCLVVQWLLCA